MVIQESYLLSTQDPITGSADTAWSFLTVTFQGENPSVWSGTHPDNHGAEFSNHVQTSPLW